ncbi:hypothetical protein [Mitsuokella jalaludinii]|uniref:hypothetical protein n=1 Tax=Mitsuokella jalaludinii TaxID=187979 RepID=UPI003A8DB8FE
MTRWSDASGFFLLETMGVAAVLIVMAGALMLFRQGVLMEEQTRFEAATCLAESELAHIEYRAAAGTLTEGASERREYVVFSPAAIGSATEDETGGDFLLRTDIQRMEQEGTYLAAVTVAWQTRGGRQHKQSYQRRVGVYERES